MDATYIREETLREKVNHLLLEKKMNKAELALKINYSRPAVSQYLNGKYNSDATEIEAKLGEFVQECMGEMRSDGSTAAPEAIPAIRPKTEYFESSDYVQTIGICKACQESRGLGIIVAKSGYGKTHALRRYAKMPRVVYIEGNETMNCKDIIRRIESRIGMPRSYGSIDERMEKVIDFFNINEGYLIIMDEADNYGRRGCRAGDRGGADAGDADERI